MSAPKPGRPVLYRPERISAELEVVRERMIEVEHQAKMTVEFMGRLGDLASRVERIENRNQNDRDAFRRICNLLEHVIGRDELRRLLGEAFSKVMEADEIAADGRKRPGARPRGAPREGHLFQGYGKSIDD